MSVARAHVPMRKINVTGNAGVGKSTVAAELARLLDLELVGLDAVVWRPGWQPTPPDERRRLEEAIAARPSWVVDGVSRPIRHAADTVVFLDFQRRVSLVRSTRRSLRYLFRSRPGLPKGCPEILIIPRLLKLIWDFPNRARPIILEESRNPAPGKHFVHIRTDTELQAFLESVRRSAARRASAAQ